MIIKIKKNYRIISFFLIYTLLMLSGLIFLTSRSMNNMPESFNLILAQTGKPAISDRYGEILNSAYEDYWNNRDVLELYQIPDLLIKSFIISEDSRFYDHNGVDWRARLAALFINVKNLKYIRGASTITEQVVRLINNRPRTLWSKWVEGWEANSLERRLSKTDILKFYLNQVPYASNRRGVAQAARYYFNRDLDTLSRKEMLALVVLVRAPSRLDLYNNPQSVDKSIERLTSKLISHQIISEDDYLKINSEKLELSQPSLPVSAPHFSEYIKLSVNQDFYKSDRIITTLDAGIQNTVQSLADNTLKRLESKQVHNSAVLVADHSTGEILAWVVGSRYNSNVPGSFIDAVRVPRQPGSALKPFLYAMALEKGWTASTIINDSPLSELVGNGLHNYRNYSRIFYGPVTLRQALANSLNIPAVKTLQYVGDANYLNKLRSMDFKGLTNSADFYGDGLSLGNGEVTLYELVQAYCAFANRGVFRNLTVFVDDINGSKKRVFSEESTSIISNILSDPEARYLEFGTDSVLNFPVQTAVKTGTSSDYRDSWAVGYNYKYTVGIWMGNLDQTPTDGLTGSTGPALLLRSIFNELTRYQKTRPLFLSSKLVRYDRCLSREISDTDDENCIVKSEWYTIDTVPDNKGTKHKDKGNISLSRPVNGLHLAYNPRLPASSQYFGFVIDGTADTDRVIWNIDGDEFESVGGEYDWNLSRGFHHVSASVWRNNKKIADIGKTSFLVK